MIIGRSKIGKLPYIGKRIGVQVDTFTIDSYIVSKNLTETFETDVHIATPDLTDTFSIDAHVLTGTYTDTFTIDAILLKVLTFTIDSYLVNTHTETFSIDSHISTLGDTETFSIDSHISTLGDTETFNIDSLLRKTDTETFSIDGLLADTMTDTFSVDSHVSTLGDTETFSIDSHIMTTNTDTFTTDVTIATGKRDTFTIDSMIYITPFYKINGVDITYALADPDIEGLKNKLSKHKVPNSTNNKLYNTGIENLSFKFNVEYYNYADNDDFLAEVNSLTDECYFYHGRNDWFYRVKSISVSPKDIKHLVGFYQNEVNLELEDPYLYSVLEDTLITTGAALPYTYSNTFSNYGNKGAPFWNVTITGNYASSSHLKSVYFETLNGVDVEYSLIISDRLLSTETASLDIDGDLTCTYSDDFASSTKFGRDAYASSLASVTGGSLEISSGGYATYKMYGPHPLTENSLLTANITTTGSPYVQVSENGSTWSTAVRSTDIESGTETEYYLSGSEKLSDYYIRFYCPSGSTMSISGITITEIRDTSYYELPEIGANSSRTVRVRDAASSSHSAGIDITIKSRKWAS